MLACPSRGESRGTEGSHILAKGALQSARDANTCEFRCHCSVSCSSADNLCHNRVGQYPGLAETKRGRKRKADEMAGGQEDSDARDKRAKDRVCLVKPMDTVKDMPHRSPA